MDHRVAVVPAVLDRRDDGLEISTDTARVDVDRVTRWLSDESYWATGRPRDVVERSLVGSLCVGVYAGSDAAAEQVAFARVVTDDATFGWLCDVFVDEGWRGRGIGRWMVRVIVDELVTRRGVDRVVLATRDAHAVYAAAGFQPLAGVGRWMEIDRRPTRAAIDAFVPPAD